MHDSHTSSTADPAFPIAAGTGLAVLVGAILGVIFALFYWPDPETSTGWFLVFLWKLFCGVVVGGGASLIIGGVLAWHGGVVGVSDNRAESGQFWGIFTGALIGFSLGPALAGILGVLFGYGLPGVLFGLIVGPITGLLGWHMAYWLATSNQSGS